MKKFLILALVVFVAILILWYFGDMAVSKRAFPSLSEYMASTTPVMASTTAVMRSLVLDFPKGKLQALVADTEPLREKGLGGRASLPQDMGMLFFFDVPGTYGFWMKDMHFPLDMVWIDDQKSVIGIARHISADTFPAVFYPPAHIRYVLELNDGQSDSLGIATGTKIVF